MEKEPPVPLPVAGNVTPQEPHKVEIKLVSTQETKRLKKGVLIRRIFILISLVAVIVLSVYLASKIKFSTTDSNHPSDNVSAVPTRADLITPGQTLDLKIDSDADGIPDSIELATGYDPKGNDCVRNAGCGEASNIPRAKLRLNVVFIVDVSGSMNTEVSGQNKWDTAKAALGTLLSRKMPRYMDVGIIMYGHVGSASESDKELSCNTVEVVKQLSPLEADEMPKLLNDKSPKGWTPLAASLSKAGELLATRQGEANYIVVLSDGQETCGGNPVAVAENLHKSGIEVTTNVVGLALTDEEKVQLEAIARSGGGGFFPADKPQELERALSLSTDVLLRWEELNKCIADNVVVYSQCIGVQYIQSVNKIKELRLEYLDKNTNALGDPEVVDVRQYSEAESTVWQVYETLRRDNWDKYKGDLELIAPR